MQQDFDYKFNFDVRHMEDFPTLLSPCSTGRPPHADNPIIQALRKCIAQKYPKFLAKNNSNNLGALDSLTSDLLVFNHVYEIGNQRSLGHPTHRQRISNLTLRFAPYDDYQRRFGIWKPQGAILLVDENSNPGVISQRIGQLKQAMTLGTLPSPYYCHVLFFRVPQILDQSHPLDVVMQSAQTAKITVHTIRKQIDDRGMIEEINNALGAMMSSILSPILG